MAELYTCKYMTGAQLWMSQWLWGLNETAGADQLMQSSRQFSAWTYTMLHFNGQGVSIYCQMGQMLTEMKCLSQYGGVFNVQNSVYEWEWMKPKWLVHNQHFVCKETKEKKCFNQSCFIKCSITNIMSRKVFKLISLLNFRTELMWNCEILVINRIPWEPRVSKDF